MRAEKEQGFKEHAKAQSSQRKNAKKEQTMTENEVATQVVDAAFKDGITRIAQRPLAVFLCLPLRALRLVRFLFPSACCSPALSWFPETC